MTDPVTEHRQGDPWTIEDLANMPANGSRYELFEGSLAVSPAPGLPHAHAVYRLRRRLEAQAPPHLAVLEPVLTGPKFGKGYVDSIVVRAGERFETDDPFPISLDPADFC